MNRWLLPALAALIAITLPYRWSNLLGGSPMGFAMVWAPLLLLGLDLAVRDGRFAGGLLAGLAILFSSWTDTHMFFFGALMTPGWCALAPNLTYPLPAPQRGCGNSGSPPTSPPS